MRNNNEPAQNEQQQPTDGETGGDTSTATPTNLTQEEFNRQLDDRLRRERAKFSDYKELKEKAARLDEMEQASKSELEKANSRISELEAEREAAQAETLRYRVATRYGISDEDADLILTGTDEETLTRQAERIAARIDEEQRPRSPQPDPTQGRNGQGHANAADQFAAATQQLL